CARGNKYYLEPFFDYW
nr:immunoglobulin heavy chain junction region [Macaca mulatta]MOW25117.1 immunoglobulin heavy chain junction region [Macaca mulatta]MOW26095.1 immunoglobulin heavy chain junction region [Macaca mulatta]MOW26821.1 immunoglobulin heavy chain junction region [Macaca mulatta]